MKSKLQKVDRSFLRIQEKENQKPTPNPSIETKNKFKNIEQMEVKTGSTPLIKKLG